MHFKERKKIMLLGAGVEQCLAINKARELGYFVIACDDNPDAPGLDIADQVFVGDIKNIDSLVRLGRKEGIQGVFAHGVEIPETVSGVAEKLKLVGLSVATARRSTNKIERITTLKNFGLPVANYVAVANRQDLAEQAECLGFPLVLKPIDNAGSRGVQLVTSPEQLFSAYDEAVFYSRCKDVLLEEVLSGHQISTESIVYNGKVHTFGFADRNYSKNDVFLPYFVEDGINFPTVLSEELQISALDLVERAIKALGIDVGAAKGDLIIHNGKPYIIEMACRTSGGWFGVGSIPLATGVDPLRPLLQICMGEEPDLDALIPRYKLGCAQRYWIPRHASIFHGASGLEAVKTMKGVKMFDHFFPEPGEKLEKCRNHAQRYAQVICTADTREDAIRLADDAIASITVEQTLV